LSNPETALLGVGYGHSSSAALNDPSLYLDAHDGYLFFLYGGGLPGLALAVTLLVAFLIVAWRCSKTSASPLLTGVSTFTLLFVVMTIVRSFVAMGLFDVRHSLYTGFTFGVIAAILARRIAVRSPVPTDKPLVGSLSA
jgi:O-antigen ligase